MTQALWVLCLLLLAAGYIAAPSGPVLAVGLAALALPGAVLAGGAAVPPEAPGGAVLPGLRGKGRPAAVRLTLRRPRPCRWDGCGFTWRRRTPSPAKPPA